MKRARPLSGGKALNESQQQQQQQQAWRSRPTEQAGGGDCQPSTWESSGGRTADGAGLLTAL